MGLYCELLAIRMGLPPAEAETLRYASAMHDVGKIGIPDQILLKPDVLNSGEFSIIKRHPLIGADILSNPTSPILEAARDIALAHHERWDGSGYPHGLAGEDIPLYGRIASIADVFDVLTSQRPYKKAYPLDISLDIIRKNTGKAFDPQIAAIFFDNLNDIRAIRNGDFINDTGFEPSRRDQLNF